MEMSLLEKARRINRILQTVANEPVNFEEVSKTLSEVLNANVYIVDKNANILGSSILENFDCSVVLDKILKEKAFPKEYNEELLKITETIANVKRENRECVFEKDLTCCLNKYSTIVPIIGGGQRLGTLVLGRFGGKFTEEDLVLVEYSATVVGMEMLRSKNEEIEYEARKRAIVQMALSSLSYSELEAIEHILEELDGNEGLLIASKIADKVGITRSVIVNALRKFESAGIIESRSLGMKGTYIKILNDKLVEELKKMKA